MTTAYGRAALDSEIDELRHSATGVRNVSLHRAALKMGQLVAGDALDEATVHDELLGAGMDVGLDQREARSAIRSGLNAGNKRPRSAPEQLRPEPRRVDRPDYRLRAQLLRLAEDSSWPLEWETGKQLATIPPVLARRDILVNWDWLAERVSIPRLWATVTLLRGVATFRYLNGKTVEPPEPTEDEPHPRHPIDIAARRLVWEVESR